MTKRQITTQRDLRRAFWKAHPFARRRRIRDEFVTDARVAWCDYIETLARDGTISQDLAQRATLET